jgi:hypothetical protein
MTTLRTKMKALIGAVALSAAAAGPANASPQCSGGGLNHACVDSVARTVYAHVWGQRGPYDVWIKGDMGIEFAHGRGNNVTIFATVPCGHSYQAIARNRNGYWFGSPWRSIRC